MADVLLSPKRKSFSAGASGFSKAEDNTSKLKTLTRGLNSNAGLTATPRRGNVSLLGSGGNSAVGEVTDRWGGRDQEAPRDRDNWRARCVCRILGVASPCVNMVFLYLKFMSLAFHIFSFHCPHSFLIVHHPTFTSLTGSSEKSTNTAPTAVQRRIKHDVIDGSRRARSCLNGPQKAQATAMITLNSKDLLTLRARILRNRLPTRRLV